MAERKVAIRLGTTGKADVKNDFAEIGKSGTDAMAGVGQAAEQAATRSEAASERQLAAWRRAGEALRNAQMQEANQRAFNTQLGVGRGDSSLNAAIVQQMRERAELEDRMAIAAARLRAELDPLSAAQQRYNTELAEARTLQAAGAITTEQLAMKQEFLTRELEQTSLALSRGAGSAGQMRAASQQLSYQISDVAVSFAGGINPMMIFAQQGSQVVQAMAMMKGEAKGLLGFLAGPWGAAIMGGVTLLGLLLTSTNKAADGHNNQKSSAEDLTKAIDDLNDSLEKSIRTSGQANLAAYNYTLRLIAQVDAARSAAVEELKLARTRLLAAEADALGGRAQNFGANSIVQNRQAEIDAIDEKIRKWDEALEKGRRNARMQLAPIAEQRVAESLDAATAAAGRYERRLGTLRQQLAANKITQAQFEGQLAQAAKTRDAEIATARATKSTKGKSDADRDAANATREAAQAQRELNSDLTALIARFDPARKAALDYAATLQQIADLQNAGMLSGGDAMAFTLRASMEQRKQETEDLRRSAEEFYKSIGVDPQAEMKDIVKIIDARRQMEAEEIAAAAQKRDEAIRSTADLYMDLMQGGSRSIWRDFKEMGLRAVAEVMARLTVGDSFSGALNAVFGRGGNGAGSSFAGLFGLGGSANANVAQIFSGPAAFSTPPIYGGARASGGPVDAGMAYLVGERQPEIFVPRTRGTIIPSVAGIGGGGTTISMPIHIDATGADGEGLARVERVIDQLRAELPARIIGTFRDARSRNAL